MVGFLFVLDFQILVIEIIWIFAISEAKIWKFMLTHFCFHSECLKFQLPSTLATPGSWLLHSLPFMAN